MYRGLKLERLLIYSDIYGLGYTDADVKHLETVFTAYKHLANMEYVYRAATPAYDLVLDLYRNDGVAYLSLDRHDPLYDTIGYPIVEINGLLLKFLPQIKDINFIVQAAIFMQYQTDDLKLVIHSIDELKKHILEKSLPAFTPDYYHPVTPDIIKLFYTCAEKSAPNLDFSKKDYADMPNYIEHIAAVLQLEDDTRIAFCRRKYATSTYYSVSYDMTYDFYVTKVGDPAYNWTDEGRYFSHKDTATGQPTVFYIDEHPILPNDKEVIDNYRRGKNLLTIDNATLDTLIKRWVRRQQDIADEKAAIKALESKIKTKIEELATGGEFSYNDVIFRKNEFEYEGQKVTSKAIEMKDILKKFSGRYSEDHLNFDRVMSVWMDVFYEQATKSPTPLLAKIGDVQVVLKHTARKGKNGVVSHTYRVNDRRINKEEVSQVIGRAVCFPDTASFEEFCDTVSSCSLRYHKYLAGGIEVSAHDENFNSLMEFKISLERHKNKNFIVFNGKTIRIGDTNKLLSIVNARAMSRVIDVLLDDKVTGLTGEDIKHLMTTGRQALLDQRKREDDLLNSTIQMFGIEIIEGFTAQNGRQLSGYLIRGGIRNYVVEKDNLLVYEYPTGRYICMVDKGQNEHTNTTRLVNRFFALSNDSKLAKEISTL